MSVLQDIATVTRSGIALTTGPDRKYQEVTANQPRYTHDPVTGEKLGMIVELSRSNLCTQSEFQAGITDAPVRGGDITFNSNIDFGPLGVTNAITLTKDQITPVDTFAYKNPATTEGTTYTFSFFIKTSDNSPPSFQTSVVKSELNDCAIIIGGLPMNPENYRVFNEGDGVYRVLVGGVAGSVQNTGIVKYKENSDKEISVTGYMLTTVSTGYNTYIRRLTATATRSSDSIICSASIENECTLFFDGYIRVNAGTVLQLDSGSQSNSVYLSFSGGTLRAVCISGGVTQASMNLGVINNQERLKVAFSVKQNQFLACLNGGSVLSDSAGNLPDGIVNFRVGRGTSSSSYMYHAIYRSATLINRALSQTELQSITS